MAAPVRRWADDGQALPDWQVLRGSMLFGDISGFTKMSERLARHGKVGAEEVTDAVDACFAALLDVASGLGGELLKFGGDALLVHFEGDGHARRAAAAAIGMRAKLRSVGRLQTSAGNVTLRISMGLHSGEFHAFLVGGSHRELVLTGPAITATVRAEGSAQAGQIVMSPATAALMPASWQGRPCQGGFLLRGGRTPPEHLRQPALTSGQDLARYVPTAIRRHLLGGGGEPEHRHAGVAFIHFEGADEALATQGADHLAAQLDVLVREAQAAADQHEVAFLATDVDEDGGKLILTAGVPGRVGDDEERLLAAVRQIADNGGSLPVRIGVHAGPLFAASVGPPYRRTFTVMGDTVNLTARVMTRASAGEILATPDVLERCRLRFDLTPVEPFKAKGKRALVRAAAVGRPRARTVPGRAAMALVGREDELARLRAQLDDVRRGATQVVEIVAEQGFGKSRLAAELRSAAEPVPSVTIVCESYETATPYAPVRRLARHLVGLAVDAGRADTEAGIRRWIAERSPDLAWAMPLLGTALDFEVPDTAGTANLAPEFRRQRTAESLAALLWRATEHPAVLVVEDAHHLDEESRGVLRRLVEAATTGLEEEPGLAPPEGLLLLCTRRHGSDPVFSPAPHVGELVLGPLALEHCIDALVAATEDDPLLPREAQALAERSGGNPLFLEALILGRHKGSEPDALPLSVEAAVTSLVDRLPGTMRFVLRAASVLGEVFSVAELEALLDEAGASTAAGPRRVPTAGKDVDVERDLAAFVEPIGNGVLRFRSMVLRECAYDALPFRRRKELHVAAARNMLDRLGPEADAEAELLSLHFLHAQRFPEAWHYAMVAAKRAGAAYANGEAAVFYRRALAAARRLQELPSRDTAAAWEALGDALDRCGSYEEAAAAYRQARMLLADDPVDHARLCLKSASVPERIGRLSDAIRWLRRGLAVLDDVPGVAAGAQGAELMVKYAAMRQAQGRHSEAIRWCDRATAQARRSGALDAEAHALFIADWAWASSSRWDRVTGSPRALAIYRELGDLAGESFVLNNMGGFAYFRGQWDEAVALYRQGRDARLRMGDDSEAASGTCNIGEVLADQGHYEEAEAYLRDALRVWRAAGFRLGIGYARAFLARVLARTGRLVEAHGQLDAAVQEFSFANLDGAVREAKARRAECLVLERRSMEALEAAQGLLAEAAEDDLDTPLLQRVRGVALAQLGDTIAARAALEASLAAAVARQARFEIGLTQAVLADIVELQGDVDAAEVLRRSSDTMIAPLGIVRLPVFPVAGDEASVPGIPSAVSS